MSIWSRIKAAVPHELFREEARKAVSLGIEAGSPAIAAKLASTLGVEVPTTVVHNILSEVLIAAENLVEAVATAEKE